MQPGRALNLHLERRWVGTVKRMLGSRPAQEHSGIGLQQKLPVHEETSHFYCFFLAWCLNPLWPGKGMGAEQFFLWLFQQECYHSFFIKHHTLTACAFQVGEGRHCPCPPDLTRSQSIGLPVPLPVSASYSCSQSPFWMWTYEPKCGHFGEPFLIGWSLAVPHLAVPSRTGHQLIFYISLHLARGRLLCVTCSSLGEAAGGPDPGLLPDCSCPWPPRQTFWTILTLVHQKTASGLCIAQGLKGKVGPQILCGFSTTPIRNGLRSSPYMQCCGAVSQSSQCSPLFGKCSFNLGFSQAEKHRSPSCYLCPFMAGGCEGVWAAPSSFSQPSCGSPTLLAGSPPESFPSPQCWSHHIQPRSALHV